jgi:hypothetical protein
LCVPNSRLSAPPPPPGLGNHSESRTVWNIRDGTEGIQPIQHQQLMGKKLSKIAVAPYRASDSGPCTHALHSIRPSHAQTWSETAFLNINLVRNGFLKHGLVHHMHKPGQKRLF